MTMPTPSEFVAAVDTICSPPQASVQERRNAAVITRTKIIFWVAYAINLSLTVPFIWDVVDRLQTTYALVVFLLLLLTEALLATGFLITSRAIAGVIAVRAVQSDPNVAAGSFEDTIKAGDVVTGFSHGLRDIVTRSVLVAIGLWLLVVLAILFRLWPPGFFEILVWVYG
jgi:hypothetical protein